MNDKEGLHCDPSINAHTYFHVPGDRFSTASGTYTALDTLKLPESTAVLLCSALGGYLAEIESESEHNSLLPFLDSQAAYWIGGGDKRIEGTFEFERNWVNMTYFKWADGQPATGNSGEKRDCIVLKFGAWYDNQCHKQRRLICEYDGN